MCPLLGRLPLGTFASQYSSAASRPLISSASMITCQSFGRASAPSLYNAISSCRTGFEGADDRTTGGGSTSRRCCPSLQNKQGQKWRRSTCARWGFVRDSLRFSLRIPNNIHQKYSIILAKKGSKVVLTAPIWKWGTIVNTMD
jgi:hypothetical protein